MFWSVEKLVQATGGSLVSGRFDSPVTGISTDTRQLHRGECFVALCGDRFDGHVFLGDAVSKGAGALIVSDSKVRQVAEAAKDVALVSVPDTLYALGELARFYRRHLPIPLVGITGSNGKTSTKEMVASVLSQVWQVHKSQGNFNNLIGVPLTILSIQPHHQVAVVEMGINVPGEMDRLAQIAKPTVGLITNVQPAHLEGLHSLDRILEEKGKLWLSLSPTDLAVVNLDDERLRTLSACLNTRRVTYSSKDSSADASLEGIYARAEDHTVFNIKLRDVPLRVCLRSIGYHHVHNALGAAALALGVGLSNESIVSGLNAYRPVKMRMQIHRLEDGRVLVDDTYNANPGSVLAALRTISVESGGGPIVAVLGDMKELGSQSALLHREVGEALCEVGVKQLITYGQMAREIIRGAMSRGMPSGACFHAESHQDIVETLKCCPERNSWILVKGSRAMAMERVVEGVLAG